MRKLIFAASAIISSLIPTAAFAQLTLTCPTTGSLALNGQYTFITSASAQCSLAVDNTVSSINVTISLSNAVLTSISGSAKIDPSGTTTTAQLTYSNNAANRSVSENASITDTFSGSTTTPMAISMQSTRPNKFFAGTYIYGVTINITSN